MKIGKLIVPILIGGSIGGICAALSVSVFIMVPLCFISGWVYGAYTKKRNKDKDCG